MDILTRLSAKSDYTPTQLQLIIAAWVLSSAFERRSRVSASNGDVEEEDYDKRSIYSLLYSLYRTMGHVRAASGEFYELTFNTWGYAWPEHWGHKPTSSTDPQQFGKNAYTGLFEFDAIKSYLRAREGKVRVVEMGCGTGAGAHHICHNVLSNCTYEAVDLQRAAIETCRRKFVPTLPNRLVGTHADATKLDIPSGSADIVVVCETHVTENRGKVSDEDRAFFGSVERVLKPGGFLVWGNAIPADTWQPCFDYLESIGMKVGEVRDVTKEAVAARDQDAPRVDAYVEQCLARFHGFRIPWFGSKQRHMAEVALKNFYRNPGTYLYDTMIDGRDTYKVVQAQKTATA